MIQAIILVSMVCTNYRYSSGKLSANTYFGKGLAVFGMVYLFLMLFRLGLGMSVYSEDRWFSNYIATFFHIVLASWVLVVSYIHIKNR